MNNNSCSIDGLKSPRGKQYEYLVKLRKFTGDDNKYQNWR